MFIIIIIIIINIIIINNSIIISHSTFAYDSTYVKNHVIVVSLLMRWIIHRFSRITQ